MFWCRSSQWSDDSWNTIVTKQPFQCSKHQLWVGGFARYSPNQLHDFVCLGQYISTASHARGHVQGFCHMPFNTRALSSVKTLVPATNTCSPSWPQEHVGMLPCITHLEDYRQSCNSLGDIWRDRELAFQPMMRMTKSNNVQFWLIRICTRLVLALKFCGFKSVVYAGELWQCDGFMKVCISHPDPHATEVGIRHSAGQRHWIQSMTSLTWAVMKTAVIISKGSIHKHFPWGSYETKLCYHMCEEVEVAIGQTKILTL